MRPSLAWSRNSAPSLRAISRPALAASAWVGWTEVALSLPSRTTAHPPARETTGTGGWAVRPRLGGVDGGGPFSALAHHSPPVGARDDVDRGLVCHALELRQGVAHVAE